MEVAIVVANDKNIIRVGCNLHSPSVRQICMACVAPYGHVQRVADIDHSQPIVEGDIGVSSISAERQLARTGEPGAVVDAVYDYG